MEHAFVDTSSTLNTIELRGIENHLFYPVRTMRQHVEASPVGGRLWPTSSRPPTQRRRFRPTSAGAERLASTQSSGPA